MNSAWRKLWSGCLPERDFEGFEVDAPVADVEENAVVEKIISLGINMGLEVDSEDVEELVQELRTKLTTEELVYIQNEQQKNLAKKQSSKDEKKLNRVSPVLQSKKFVLNGVMCKHLWKNITLILWQQIEQ